MLKVADVAEQSCVTEASYKWRTLEAFGILMLKYAFSQHCRNSFSLISDI